MMRRPASVPRAARYSLRDGWWQVGEIRDGAPFGPWRTWRPDGTPLFEARFDSRGRLQGAFKRFHPDGSLAREARYRRGAATGQIVYYRAKGAAGDLFPSADPRAWQVVVRIDEDGDETRVLLDEQGRELAAGELDLQAPADETRGALDPLFAAAEPEGFLESGALARVLEALPPAPPRSPDDNFLLPAERPPRRPLDARRFQDLYGVPPLAPLRAWLEAPECRLLGLRPAADQDLAAAGNVVEALIAEHQAAPGRAFGLRALLAGLLPLAVGDGTLAGSLRYCYALGESANAPTDAIYPFDVADDSLGPPVARTLDDLGYALALAAAAGAGAVSLRALQRAYVRLRGRVALPALAATEGRALVDEDDETVGDEAGDHREGFHFRRANQYPRHFFYRARWLVRLLAGHVEGAARDFDPKFEGGLDDQRFERIKGFLREPHVAAYWMLRCHVFADPRLPELLAIAADSPAQLVRDLAALVRELEGGRKRLGAIEDWPAVLAAFRARDPLSNRGEDDGEGGEAEAEAVAPLAYPEELAAAGAVVEWARREGYSRENLLIYDELDAAALGLARRADPRIVPFLVELHGSDPWRASRLLAPWLDGDRADLAALADTARAWLRDQESGALFRWLGGARILQRVGTSEDGALLAAVVEPLLESMFGRGQGFAAALGSLEAKRALEPIMDALITLGVPDAFVPVLEGVVDAETHLVDDARGACALALASLGRGLDAIVAGVARQLDKKHGHRIQLGQLLAIGQLGAARPEPERAALLARLEDIPRLDAFAAVGQRLALHALGRAGDPAAIVRDGLALERYSDDDTARQRVVLLRLVERSRELPPSLALPYVLTDQLDVHRAAVRCLAARGVPAPELVLYDPYHVAELALRGRDALHAALADDRGVFRGNLALWLGDHPDPASREVLAANARRLARPDFPDEGPVHYELRWTVRALLRTGGAEDVLDELLRSGHPHVADPVLRYADELGAGVARGMAHVFVHDQHWRQSTAKAWLARHVAEPGVAEALAEHGLAAADVTKSDEDEEEDGDDDDGGDE